MPSSSPYHHVRATGFKKKLHPSSDYETLAQKKGFKSVAGVDEVGRGCLFGPVLAAAVILDPNRPIHGLQDSKQVNTQLREVLNTRILEMASAFAFGAIDSTGIDRWNIREASRRAMQIAVQSLNVEADFLLVDAMELETDTPQKCLIKGDVRCTSIAAASILAKVKRDNWMKAWSKIYPLYNLSSNKGYATPDHLEALRTHGPTPLHRFSFQPVRKADRFGLYAAIKSCRQPMPLFPEETPA